MAVPISFNGLSDGIHRIRQLADKYTPGIDTLANVRAWPWMAPMYGAAQGDIMEPNPGSAFVRPSAPPAQPPAAQPPTQQPSFGQGAGPVPFQNNPFGQGFPPQPPAQSTAPAPAPNPAQQVATPPQTASVPMPQARPAQAPPAPPDMSFWQRNAAMMRDPATGAFIDPTSAAQAQVRGPDLINKMLAYLHNKDIG
ncbi:MAG: hypothetical protein ACHP7H_00570 [Hyphomicrobiales bacterium]